MSIKSSFKIISYDPRYRDDFARLNIAWLEEFFVVEAIDKLVLGNPEEYILDKGGEIYFALENGKAVGTVALKKEDEGRYELTKLGVDNTSQKGGIGRALCMAVIDRFVELDADLLFLETNKVLTPAIKLYEKLDFVEKQNPFDTPYERADYYMEWHGNGLKIRQATSKTEVETVKGFCKDYAVWLEGETGLSLEFQGFEEEMSGFPDSYETLLLATYNSSPVGAVALKAHTNDVSEMKRLFVAPEAWGKGAGEALSLEIMKLAKNGGYKVMLLDSLKRLESAVSLYRRLGFEETEPYNENPEADVIYMKRTL